MDAVTVLTSLEDTGLLADSILGVTPIKASVVDDEHGQTDDIPAPHISNSGHGVAVFIYLALLATYLVFSVLAFIDRPDVESFTQEPTTNYPAPSIDVRLQCFDTATSCGTITIHRNYSTAFDNCPLNTDAFSVEVGRTLQQNISIPLCYVDENDVVSTETGELLGTPGLAIDFSRIARDASASVVVQAGRMRKAVTLNTWEVKSFYIGLNVKEKHGEVTYDYYAQNLQYDGKRPSARATYMIRIAQFANVYRVSRPGSWLDIVAGLGGAATILTFVMLCLMEPLLSKVLPGGEQRLRKGRMARVRALEAEQKEQANTAPDTAAARSAKPSRGGPQGDTHLMPGTHVLALYGGEWLPAVVSSIAPNEDVEVIWKQDRSYSCIPAASVLPLERTPRDIR